MNIDKISDKVASMWVEKYRPKKLGDLIVCDQVREDLEKIRTSDDWPHILFCGVQGCGKTTTAKIIANELVGGDILYINASDENGVDVIRNKVMRFVSTSSFTDALKIVILDEADGMTPQAQRTLRNTMEEYQEHCRFIITANRPQSIIAPLKSRTQEIDLQPPINAVLRRCLIILKKEGVKFDKDQISVVADLVKARYPDIRKIINILQQHSRHDVLELSDVSVDEDFLSSIVKFTFAKDFKSLRQLIIDNEEAFHKDYHALLKDLFNFIQCDDKVSLEYEQRAIGMVTLSEHMYRHGFVMDPEINAYSALVKIGSGL